MACYWHLVIKIFTTVFHNHKSEKLHLNILYWKFECYCDSFRKTDEFCLLRVRNSLGYHTDSQKLLNCYAETLKKKKMQPQAGRNRKLQPRWLTLRVCISNCKQEHAKCSARGKVHSTAPCRAAMGQRLGEVRGSSYAPILPASQLQANTSGW